jgi:hypothetical protein
MDIDQTSDYSKWLRNLDQSIYYYPYDAPHYDLVRKLICDWLSETQSHVTALRKLLIKLNETIDVGICDSPLIGGYSEPGYDAETEQRSSLVQVNLGIFPKVLGLANRAHTARFFGAHQPMVRDTFENWSVNETSVRIFCLGAGHVDKDTYNSVNDCATLSFLHELAHCQEPFPAPTTPEQSRAIEACADEGSGYLFARRIASQHMMLKNRTKLRF